MPAKKNKAAKPALTNPIFTDADKAREHLEALRWPDGPYCPHCGDTENVVRMEGAAHRKGLHNCRSCRKQFSVTVGTLFERSHIPLNKWLLAFHLMAASKKGMSAHQMHRQLDITYKTAWFMCHRIREAMKQENRPKLGGAGKVVEVDETFFGKRPQTATKRGTFSKNAIVALVERDGESRAFHVARVSGRTAKAVLNANADKASHLMTDESGIYKQSGAEFATHYTTNHSRKQYSKPINNSQFPELRRAHSNTVEGFFSILKRGLIGTYHHVGAQHLGRYVNEFDFRYNHRRMRDEETGKWVMMPDAMRAAIALQGITGKRLTYRRLEVH